jgi:hypothetical protein
MDVVIQSIWLRLHLGRRPELRDKGVYWPTFAPTSNQSPVFSAALIREQKTVSDRFGILETSIMVI